MLINIEDVNIINGGNSSAIIHNIDNTINMFSNKDGKLTYHSGSVPLGIWNSLKLENINTTITDSDVSNIRHTSIIDTLSIIVWTDGNSHRILVIPDDLPVYDPTSPYRLYWAVDSEKLYMNISDTWQMVGTLNHKLLNDVGKYTHIDIDNTLDYLQTELSNIEGGQFDIVEW